MNNINRQPLLVILLIVLQLLLSTALMMAQSDSVSKKKMPKRIYWNTNLNIVPYRLSPPPVGYKPVYIDFDKDGDPDAIQSVTINNTPVLWIDDDDDMQYGDIEGDTDSDCLLIDRNKDGKYGKLGDLVIDWVDTNNDGKADMQVIAEYPEKEQNKVWPNGHYMWVLDTDHDNIFNYIDWNIFQVKSWEHNGIADFFPDYSGKSMFLKVHAATNRMENLKLNWENPFLFYDPDNDGLSEMAIRLCDSPTYFNNPENKNNPETMKLSGKIDWASIAVDLDNDNGTGDEFDFDFTIGFRGKGFDYMDQVHKFSMGSLPGTDSCFIDPRWRHLDELIYTDHANAQNRIFSKGEWDKVYFVYDEDDDCHRWERVEFLDPLDPFKIGNGKGGIDNNPQSDATGDRGEWDLDNSGNGKLYVSKFDGRLHLFGAEWGCWRIDQTASCYQGFSRNWLNKEPTKFSTVKYSDTDNNGFIDQIEYDMDGDQNYEEVVDFNKLGVDDKCELIDLSAFDYKDYTQLMKKVAADLWKNAQSALKVAEKYKLNTNWYAKLKQAGSTQEKYIKGYWLQYYVFKDLEDSFFRNNNNEHLHLLCQAYFSGNWNLLLHE